MIVTYVYVVIKHRFPGVKYSETELQRLGSDGVKRLLDSPHKVLGVDLIPLDCRTLMWGRCVAILTRYHFDCGSARQ